MKVLDEITVKVEKLSNLGFGIAKPDGFTVFIDKACPEDTLKVKITKLNKKWAEAKIVEIIEPSPYRVEAKCPLQNVCGGCQLQFIDYKYQLELKKEIVEDAIKSISNLDIEIKAPIPSPENYHYRHKVQYPIAQTKVSEKILAGYYKPKSHEIINIKYCPIQPKICDNIIEYIRSSAVKNEITGYNEKKHKGDLRHVVLRISADTGKVLVTLVVNATKVFPKLKTFAEKIYEKFEEIDGVCVNFNSKKTNVILGAKTELIAGKGFITEKLSDKTFKIGPKTFFQINPKSAENIFKFVKNYIKNNFENPTVLDAYAGIASFGICISDICKKVVSVEENSDAIELAREVLEQNKIDNVELQNMDTQDFCEKELKEKFRRYDAIILDPPRKGCSQESLEYALKLCKGKIIYVSCNPATLARDLKYLTEKGATVEYIQPFDMFCHTYHIENVAIISLN